MNEAVYVSASDILAYPGEPLSLLVQQSKVSALTGLTRKSDAVGGVVAGSR